ncbi:hypothetical protein [Psychromicrobium xiongbiense]|uniref:hypothetical protein n=1 Tax=Psychromicrobium xiongbiense TaxID=3051184 RepID=UPI002556A18E|nr:hypothetical protein [Psychromicrobium sp. YIM S02556]
MEPPPIPSIRTILVGALLMVLAGVVVVLPYVLFVVGGGGNSTSFTTLTQSFWFAGILFLIAGAVVVLVGVIRSVREERRRRQAGFPGPTGRPLGAVALALVIHSALPFISMYFMVGSVAGLIVGYVSRWQSKKAGLDNGPALAAIIVGWAVAALTAFGWVLYAVLITRPATGIHF